MFAACIVKPSMPPYALPVVLVKKKHGTWMIFVDYKRLIAVTMKSKFPMLVVDELLDELVGTKWFSKLDLRAGYHQIRLAPGEEHKTTFQTDFGHFEFLVLSFGLTGGPNTFNFALNETLSPCVREFVLLFFDDILVFSRNLHEHIEHLKEVFETLQQHQLYAKLSKCTFVQPQVEYLGHD